MVHCDRTVLFKLLIISLAFSIGLIGSVLMFYSGTSLYSLDSDNAARDGTIVLTPLIAPYLNCNQLSSSYIHNNPNPNINNNNQLKSLVYNTCITSKLPATYSIAIAALALLIASIIGLFGSWKGGSVSTYIFILLSGVSISITSNTVLYIAQQTRPLALVLFYCNSYDSAVINQFKSDHIVICIDSGPNSVPTPNQSNQTALDWLYYLHLFYISAILAITALVSFIGIFIYKHRHTVNNYMKKSQQNITINNNLLSNGSNGGNPNHYGKDNITGIHNNNYINNTLAAPLIM